jgi:hypothetical protein
MGIRANINLDADVYSFATAYAAAKGMPLGAAVSELLRKVEHGSKSASEEESPRLIEGPLGYLVKEKTGRVITPEMVKEGSEDEFV